MSSNKTLETIGSLSERIGVAQHRVRYVVRSRRIRPVGRIGNAWVYGLREMDAIIRHLAAIEDVKQQRRLEEVSDDESV